MARIPEDRHAVGLVGELPSWKNAVSERLRGRAFSRGGWVRRAAARAHAAGIVQAFDVRGGPDTPARSLSGGNMQKLILGRALRLPPGDGEPLQLVVAHQPTWGLDIGAVAYVQAQVAAARDTGAAVLLASDDLAVAMAMGARIAVTHEGRLSAALQAAQPGAVTRSAWRWPVRARCLIRWLPCRAAAVRPRKYLRRPLHEAGETSAAPGAFYALRRARESRAIPRLSRRVGPRAPRSRRCSPCQGRSLGDGPRLAITGLWVQRGYIKVHNTLYALLQGGFGSVFAWSETLPGGAADPRRPGRGGGVPRPAVQHRGLVAREATYPQALMRPYRRDER